MDKQKQVFIFSENFEVVTNKEISDSELYERELTQSQEAYFGS